jgi:ribosomal protein L7/L12
MCGEENPSGVGLCKTCGGSIPMEESQQPDVAPGSFEEQLLTLLRQGNKIQAIKLYREKSGTGLKEAKDAVEDLAKQHNITSSRSGCASVLLIFAVVIIIVHML